ncbi:MAG: restriction endonuclease [Ignavibacteriales bacterium]|nr:MAG: restriction endonuclease [Ignavibacteriales bacterium]
MKLTQKYSHLNGEEYLLVHHKKEYKEIEYVINTIDAEKHLTKESEEKTRRGKLVYNPVTLNGEFKSLLYEKGWEERRRDFYVSTDPNIVKILEPLDFKQQKKILEELKHPLLNSFNQTDFIKNKIAVEVQLGKYFAVTYDLFVKHLSFYTGQIINIGIEIVPTKNMQKNMSSGPPWFEKEVHNVLRHGRTNPPVPLLIIGIEP